MKRMSSRGGWYSLTAFRLRLGQPARRLGGQFRDTAMGDAFRIVRQLTAELRPGS
jgi:hypothetical protein